MENKEIKNNMGELDDSALDSIAGGRDGWTGAVRHCVRNKNYACSNCGGHEFFIMDGDTHYYSGNCMNCGTYNSRVAAVAEAERFCV